MSTAARLAAARLGRTVLEYQGNVMYAQSGILMACPINADDTVDWEAECIVSRSSIGSVADAQALKAICQRLNCNLEA